MNLNAWQFISQFPEGLETLVGERGVKLSGGQRQRVAVARALVNNPSIILADEPTGNLDSQNGDAVMQLLADLNEQGVTICMVTHDSRYAHFAKRTVHLFDGQLVDTVSKTANATSAKRMGG